MRGIGEKMGETKKDILIITMVIFVITAIGLIMDDLVKPQDTAMITVNCEYANESGQFMLIEFKDLVKNSNGTYNTSQFANNNGVWNGKVTNVTIKNGKANYTLSEDTEVFAVDNYITNLSKDYDSLNETAPKIDIKFIYNDDEVLSSNEQAYFDQCDISWGGKLYHRNGIILGDDELNMDLPNLQESREFVMSLYFNETGAALKKRVFKEFLK